MKPRLISYVIFLCGFVIGFGGPYLLDSLNKPKWQQTQQQFEQHMRERFHQLKEERNFRIDQ